MLVAEVRGKAPNLLANDEDCLTAAVFGHLRYLPPSVFWPTFFRYCRSIDGSSLFDQLHNKGWSVQNYSDIQMEFWPSLEEGSEPDLVLRFSGSQVPVFLIIEVKLWAGKSSTDLDDDQLCRYLRIGERSACRENRYFAGVVYLTPRVAIDEVGESLSIAKANSLNQQIWIAQWQDVTEAARHCVAPQGYATLILGDVVKLLQRRGLEHFAGFRMHELPEGLTGSFYGSSSLWTELALDKLDGGAAPWRGGS